MAAADPNLVTVDPNLVTANPNLAAVEPSSAANQKNSEPSQEKSMTSQGESPANPKKTKPELFICIIVEKKVRGSCNKFTKVLKFKVTFVFSATKFSFFFVLLMFTTVS